MIVSISQIKNFSECMRLWAFGALDRSYGPQGDEARDGDELHAHVRNYVKFDIEIDESRPMGRLAALGKPYFPSRADEPHVEQSDQVVYGAHGWTVKPDLMWYAPRSPIIVDHKKVDNYRFALSTIDLRVDLQAVVYAYYAMRYYGTEECTALWLYYKASEPIELRPVETLITYEDALRVLRTYQKTLDQMAALKQQRGLRALEIVGNRDRCMKYGEQRACFHFAQCFPEEAVARAQHQQLQQL